ncbi:MAG: M1 family metallopeptidase [Woeseiaceae bacterium]|nr:M1 family metallopeptidase [Woeseiaceae bacterium]
MRHIIFSITMLMLISPLSWSDAIRQTKGDFYDAFRQLDVDLPSPNVYRTASGAPGPQYWQQEADYHIKLTLDENKRHIEATEEITYKNNSPDTLNYIWLQLDQNRFADNSLERRSTDVWMTSNKDGSDRLTYNQIAVDQLAKDIDYGYDIKKVADRNGDTIPYTIVDTMMRLDLPKALSPGDKITFSIDWSFYVLLEARVGSRGGYEYFPDSDTSIYFLAQWFPRLAAYTDYAGWQHKAFLGRGEFTLEFGDYTVEITVPDDHIISATGELQNPKEVLTAEQRERLKKADKATKPIFIVTPEEALENEKEKSNGQKTWIFKADNVRDFAWSSSRKYIWDAMTHHQDDKKQPTVLAMSFYPNEAEPIWSKYSTHAVVHTLDVYSRFSFAYPYPTAQSVNSWKSGGMEYPMITFNGYRPEPFESNKNEENDTEDDVNNEQKDEDPKNTYSRRTKYGLIGVIIHEIGHIYFPMTVNSDERQWTWMDEGINSFLEYLAEFEWEEEFPAYGNDVNVLDYITDYMRSENQVPIMTNSDSVWRLGPNAYSKPTAALTVLRETVMGRELFDFAFKEYSQRWKFKRPTPSDFFRTMEDASGVDLDWFWRGWFYSTDHVDIALTSVREYKVSTTNPEVEFPYNMNEYDARTPEALTQIRNRNEKKTTYLKRNPELVDFYNENDRFTVSNKDKNKHSSLIDGLETWEYNALVRATEENDFIYFADFENIGGLNSPLPLLITYIDDSEEFLTIPAEIWRRSYKKVTKLLIRQKAIKSIELDSRHETADTDFSNNHYPSRIEKSRIELYKSDFKRRDLMADMLKKLRKRKTGDDKTERTVPLIQSN